MVCMVKICPGSNFANDPFLVTQYIRCVSGKIGPLLKCTSVTKDRAVTKVY